VNADSSSRRGKTSKVVHRFDAWTTRPTIAIAVAVAVAASWIAIAVGGFQQEVQVAFATVCGGVTVAMVFVLQHTQRRQQLALQLKLDELVRALPQADDHLIGVEVSTDAEMMDHENRTLDRFRAIRDDDT
jgi:low affinity Fe/Cu permease